MKYVEFQASEDDHLSGVSSCDDDDDEFDLDIGDGHSFYD